MEKFFEIDDVSIRSNFKRFMQKAPKRFALAASNVLNTIAFGSRKSILRVIKNSMTVRAEKFIASSIWVKKSQRGKPLHFLESSVGVIEKPRYTGMVEQIEGGKKKRSVSLEARGGKKRGRIKGKYKLKPGKTLPRVSKYRNAPDPLTALISRIGSGKPFIVDGGVTRMPAGEYVMKKHKILMLQSFDSPDVKKNNWMMDGVNDYMRRVDLLKVWVRATERVLPKKM
jgi:hypothetical protein